MNDKSLTSHPSFSSVSESFHLAAINGSSINIHGKVTLQFRLAAFTFNHVFYIADVEHNILGIDFFELIK